MPRGLLRLVCFERVMYEVSTTGAFSGERENMDPERGLGFTLEDLSAVEAVFGRQIWQSLMRGFEPL
jgi:hypothetical protein